MQKDRETSLLSRRRLLVRIGLVAGAAYVAPAMVGLNAAHASRGSGGSVGPGCSFGPVCSLDPLGGFDPVGQHAVDLSSACGRSGCSGRSRPGTAGLARRHPARVIW